MAFNFLKKKKDLDSDSKSTDSDDESVSEGKYAEPCALCGKAVTDKKWMGQFWHKKCLRQTKKMSKKMV